MHFLNRHRKMMADEGAPAGAGAAAPSPSPGTPPTPTTPASSDVNYREKYEASIRENATTADRLKKLEGALDNTAALAADLKATKDAHAAQTAILAGYEKADNDTATALLGKLPEERRTALAPLLEQMAPKQRVAFLQTEAIPGEGDLPPGTPPAPPAGNIPGAPPVAKRYKPKFAAHIEDAIGRDVKFLDKMIMNKEVNGDTSFQLNRRDWRDLLKGKSDDGQGVALTKENAAARGITVK